MNNWIIFWTIYIIGVGLSLMWLHKDTMKFRKEHPGVLTKREMQQEDSLDIVASLFSWFMLFALIVGKFIHIDKED